MAKDQDKKALAWQQRNEPGWKGGETTRGIPPVPVDELTVEEVCRTLKYGLLHNAGMDSGVKGELERWVKEREDEIDRQEGRNPEDRGAALSSLPPPENLPPEGDTQPRDGSADSGLSSQPSPQAGGEEVPFPQYELDPQGATPGVEQTQAHRLSGGETASGGGQH